MNYNNDINHRAAEVLKWSDERTVVMDSTILFSHGHDHFGNSYLSEEAKGARGKFLIWPSSDDWYIYDSFDGGLASFSSKEKAIEAANRWNSDHFYELTLLEGATKDE